MVSNCCFSRWRVDQVLLQRNVGSIQFRVPHKGCPASNSNVYLAFCWVMWSLAEEWLPLLVPEMGTLTAHLCIALTSCHRHARTDESAAINLLCWNVRFYNSILLALCRGKRLYVCVGFGIQFWLELGTNLQATAGDLSVQILSHSQLSELYQYS